MTPKPHTSQQRGPESIAKEDWYPPLSRPVAVINGIPLRTLADVRARILGLSAQRRNCFAWRHAAVLLIATARGEIADVQEVTIAVDLALRLDRLAIE
jgi:hypothetical protein